MCHNTVGTITRHACLRLILRVGILRNVRASPIPERFHLTWSTRIAANSYIAALQYLDRVDMAESSCEPTRLMEKTGFWEFFIAL